MSNKNIENSKSIPRRGMGEYVPREEKSGGVHHCSFPQASFENLPPVKKYCCYKTKENIVIDGKLNGKAWSDVAWSDRFGRIDDGSNVDFETRIALLWDDNYLYAAYKIEDPDIRGTISNYNSFEHVYWNDEDAELFVHGDDAYYEIGVNPINQTYQLKWNWIGPLVENKDYDALDSLFKVSNYIYYAKRKGEQIGRMGNMDFELEDLKTAIYIDGVINCPRVKDKGWTVEFALPWKSLKKSIGGNKSFPPKEGDVLKIAAYRAHQYRGKKKPAGIFPFEGWTWSCTGNHNIHVPERWTEVKFLNEYVKKI